MVRTHNGGHVALGKDLSITNGVTREVRAMILEREAKGKERRKAYRKRPGGKRPGSKADNFTDFKAPAYLC